MRWYLSVLLVLLPSIAYGGGLRLGYENSRQGSNLVNTFSAALEEKLLGLNLGAGIVSRDEDENWKLSMNSEWMSFNYIGGDSTPELLSLKFKRSVGSGLLNLSFVSQELTNLERKEVFNLDYEIKW